MRRSYWLLLCALALAGCSRPMPPLADPKPPEVKFVPAVRGDVIDEEEFTGRTEPSAVVEVRPRVTGRLANVLFKEGSDVTKGQVLAEIDHELFTAQRDRAKAELDQAEARVTRLEADFERIQKQPAGAVSRAEYDKVVGDLTEARFAVRSARETLRIAQTQLSYTKITAPISGRIGRRLVDAGNQVKVDETTIAGLVALDPIYALFDVDERTYLSISRHLMNQKKRELTLDDLKQIPVSIGLADETGFPHKGTIDFVDNRIDPTTGSVWARGVFENTNKMLAPGLFVRVRVIVGEPRKAVLIPERALGTDQGQKFVYVIKDTEVKDKDGKTVVKPIATDRRVEIGVKQGQLREIKKGIEPGERVIVSGLQRVRPGLEVDPKEDEKK